jgi:hypothetical protein
MNKRLNTRWQRTGWFVWLALSSGCSGEFVPVSGHVEWQGKPLEKGMVMFHPEESEPRGVGVGVIANGTYSIRTGARNGIRPGAYRVTVAEFTAPTSSVAGAPPALLTPKQYSQPQTTPLKFTVPPTRATFDIVLANE